MTERGLYIASQWQTQTPQPAPQPAPVTLPDPNQIKRARSMREIHNLDTALQEMKRNKRKYNQVQTMEIEMLLSEKIKQLNKEI